MDRKGEMGRKRGMEREIELDRWSGGRERKLWSDRQEGVATER